MKNKRILASLMAIVIAISTIFTISIPVFAAESNASSTSRSVPVFDSNEWLMADAYYDEANGYFVLTEDYSSWQNGSVWYNHPYDNNFTLEMDYYTGSSDRSLGGADGIVVAFYANYSYTMSSGEEMGFTGCGGFGVELDTYHNGNQGDPSNNHIALIKGNVGTHLVTNTLPESEDEQWHHLKVVVEDGVCTAYVDGNEKFSHAIEETGYGWIGITSATGNGHNLHAVKNVIVTGNSSTSIDGRYLDLKLSHRKESNNCTSDSVNGVYEYEITAEIKNSAEATAQDIVATLDLKEGLRVADEASLSINLGDVASGESVYAKWTVYADWPESNIAANYGVTANIGNSASLRQENYIYLVARNAHDNTLNLTEDIWGFTNDSPYFDTSFWRNEKYYLSDFDYSLLSKNLSNTDLHAIDEAMKSKWRGSCYGMSAIAVLTKAGVIVPDTIQDEKNTLYSISKENNDAVESFINFYHLQQNTSIVVLNRYQFSLLDTESKLEKIVEMASSISTGGLPFTLDFYGDFGGHTVVVYGINYGSFWADGESYDTQILIYDCSNVADPYNSHLYINSETNDWCIPHWNADRLGMACNDISVLDYVNYETSEINYLSRIELYGDIRKYAIVKNGETFPLLDVEGLSRQGIVALRDTNDAIDTDTTKTILILPENMSECSIITTDDTELNATLYCDNAAFTVKSEQGDKIDFNSNGDVTLFSSKGMYELTSVFNDGHSTTSWSKTTIIGQDGDNISFSQSADGVILTGTNLQNVSIKTTDNSGTQTTMLSTDCNSVLLTSDESSGNIPIVMLDSNGDGSYESEYNKYTVTFDANGGTGDMDALENVAAGAIILPSNGFNHPSGMRFKGWSENATGTVIEGTEYVVSDNVTLYAIWEEVEGEPDTQPNDEITDNTTTDGPGSSNDDVSDDMDDGVTENPIDTEMIKLIAIGVVIAGVLIGVIVLIAKKKRF